MRVLCGGVGLAGRVFRGWGGLLGFLGASRGVGGFSVGWGVWVSCGWVGGWAGGLVEGHVGALLGGTSFFMIFFFSVCVFVCVILLFCYFECRSLFCLVLSRYPDINFVTNNNNNISY